MMTKLDLTKTVKWLTYSDEPSVKFLALTDLLGRRVSDPRLKQARRERLHHGWIQAMLANQSEGGYWTNPDTCYQPKYSATVWHLQLLAMLRADGSDERIRHACERFLRMHAMPDGGFTCSDPDFPRKRSEECLVGRMLAILLQFRYPLNDERVQRPVDWLIDRQLSDGGWNCRWGSRPRHSSIYSSYMALWGLSNIPRCRRTKELDTAIGRGIDFMLAHGLYKSHRTGLTIDEHWLKLHFPQ